MCYEKFVNFPESVKCLFFGLAPVRICPYFAFTLYERDKDFICRLSQCNPDSYLRQCKEIYKEREGERERWSKCKKVTKEMVSKIKQQE